VITHCRGLKDYQVMLTTTYISNCTESDIDEIKIASLYFDKIDIVNNVLYTVQPDKEDEPLEAGGVGVITEVTNFVTETFLCHVELLLRENIVSIVTDETQNEDKLWQELNSIAFHILSSERDILFSEAAVPFDANGGNKVHIMLSPMKVRVFMRLLFIPSK